MFDPPEDLTYGQIPPEVAAYLKMPGVNQEKTLAWFNLGLSEPQTFNQAVLLAQAVGYTPEQSKVVAAQWQKESGGGAHVGAAYNYFGIKAHNQAVRNALEARGIKVGTGEPTSTKEVEGGKTKTQQSSFMQFNNAFEAFAGHKAFLETNQRYAGALGAETAKDFAMGLQKAGYATDPNYGTSLYNDYIAPKERNPVSGDTRPKSLGTPAGSKNAPTTPMTVAENTAPMELPIIMPQEIMKRPNFSLEPTITPSQYGATEYEQKVIPTEPIPMNAPAGYFGGGKTGFRMGGNLPSAQLLNTALNSQYGGQLNTNTTDMYRTGGGIHINPAHEGNFTAKANAANMSVQEYARHVLSAPEGQFDPSTRSQANFAHNAAGWQHAMGGNLYSTGGNFNNPGFNALPTTVQNKIRSNSFADGGPLTEFNAGGTHEQNPLGGIPQGTAPDGRPNLVEQGETKLDASNYIFSDNIKISKDTAEQFNLPKSAIGKTFADISKVANKPKSRRETDTIENTAKTRELEALMQAQETQKEADLQKDIAMMTAKHPEFMQSMMQQQQSVQPMGMPQAPPPEAMGQPMPPEGMPMDPNQIPPEMLAQMEGAQQGQPVMRMGGGMYMCGGKMYNFGGSMYAEGGPLYAPGNTPVPTNNGMQFPSERGGYNIRGTMTPEEVEAHWQEPSWVDSEVNVNGQQRVLPAGFSASYPAPYIGGVKPSRYGGEDPLIKGEYHGTHKVGPSLREQYPLHYRQYQSELGTEHSFGGSMYKQFAMGGNLGAHSFAPGGFATLSPSPSPSPLPAPAPPPPPPPGSYAIDSYMTQSLFDKTWPTWNADYKADANNWKTTQTFDKAGNPILGGPYIPLTAAQKADAIAYYQSLKPKQLSPLVWQDYQNVLNNPGNWGSPDWHAAYHPTQWGVGSNPWDIKYAPHDYSKYIYTPPTPPAGATTTPSTTVTPTAAPQGPFYMLDPHTAQPVMDYDPVTKQNVPRLAPEGSISNIQYAQGVSKIIDTPAAREEQKRDADEKAMSGLIMNNPDEKALWETHKKENPNAIFIDYRNQRVPVLQQQTTTPATTPAPAPIPATTTNPASFAMGGALYANGGHMYYPGGPLLGGATAGSGYTSGYMPTGSAGLDNPYASNNTNALYNMMNPSGSANPLNDLSATPNPTPTIGVQGEGSGLASGLGTGMGIASSLGQGAMQAANISQQQGLTDRQKAEQYAQTGLDAGIGVANTFLPGIQQVYQAQKGLGNFADKLGNKGDELITSADGRTSATRHNKETSQVIGDIASGMFNPTQVIAQGAGYLADKNYKQAALSVVPFGSAINKSIDRKEDNKRASQIEQMNRGPQFSTLGMPVGDMPVTYDQMPLEHRYGGSMGAHSYRQAGTMDVRDGYDNASKAGQNNGDPNNYLKTDLTDTHRDLRSVAPFGSMIADIAPMAYNLYQGLSPYNEVRPEDLYSPMQATRPDYSQAENQARQSYARMVNALGASGASGGQRLAGQLAGSQAMSSDLMNVMSAEENAYRQSLAEANKYNAAAKSQAMMGAMDANWKMKAAKQESLKEAISAPKDKMDQMRRDAVALQYAQLGAPDISKFSQVGEIPYWQFALDKYKEKKASKTPKNPK